MPAAPPNQEPPAPATPAAAAPEVQAAATAATQDGVSLLRAQAILTPSAAVPPSGETTGARPTASGKLAQERYTATQKWLRTAPSGTWTIQLMTAGDSQAIERFLEEAARSLRLENVYLYGVKQDGRQLYGVTYGNYATLEDTITAMGELPTSFKSRGPFHRSISVMRRQNQE